MPTKKSAPDFALQVEEARAFRLESLAEAWKAAHDQAQEYRDIAKYILKESRALQKTADRFLKEADGRKVAAKQYYAQLRAMAAADPLKQEEKRKKTQGKDKKTKKTG